MKNTSFNTKGKSVTRRVPRSYQHVYRLNAATGFHDLTYAPQTGALVTNELRVEERLYPGTVKAETIVKGRTVNGVKLFFTGIRETEFAGWFYGDRYELTNGVKKNSLCLFHFAEQGALMTLFYFDGYKLYPNRRAAFFKKVIPTLIAQMQKGRDQPPSLLLFNTVYDE